MTAPAPTLSASASRALLGDDSSEEIVGYVRSASDVLRLATFSVLAALLWALARWAEHSIGGVERDLVRLFSFASPQVGRIIAGTAQIAVGLITIAVFVPAFVTKRYRLLGYILTGNILTGTLVSLVLSSLQRPAISQILHDATNAITINTAAIHPSVIAEIVSSFVILGPFVSPRWRRAGVITIVLVTLARLVVSTNLPTELLACLAIGATSGCVVLLAYGRPDQRPTIASVISALAATGLRVTHLEPDENPLRASTAYFADLDDGTRVYAKVLSPEERSADLLFRAYRFVRLKNVGDERPFSSLRRSAEHEALVALLARSTHVRTPELRTVVAVGDESMLLVYTAVAGTPLDRLKKSEISDDVLAQIWQQQALLASHRITHRNLRLNNLIASDDGPWLVDFGFGEVAADEQAIAGDTAQLLVSLAIAVGPERATDSALSALGPDPICRALPLLQPGALAGATRAALKEQPHLLDELRATVQQRGVTDPPELAQLERFNRRTLFIVATLALATYFLIPQFGNVGDIINRVGSANWWWFAPTMVAAALTFVGATLAVMGSVKNRLPTGPTLLAQVASSFASKLAPAGLGGMALNTRFIQKTGVDPAVAVSSVGLNFAAGIIVHVLMLITFAVWAGRDAFGAISLPDPAIALYGVAGVALVAGVAFAIPSVRKQVLGRFVPIVRRALGGIGETLRHPTKVALLFGGSALVTSSYLVALFFAVEAFGGSDLSFAQVGAIYLAASAVATIAPTPGGLGALEAACIAGLVAAGMPNEVAVPSVFLYRLATFWIPVAPGWFAFTYLQRVAYL